MKCERCGFEYEGNTCLRCVWRMNWGCIHDEEGQLGRMERACSIDPPTEIDMLNGKGVFKGSAKKPYETTLVSCTCTDYMRAVKRKHAMPCKHIYRLAMECGAMEKPDVGSFPVFSEDMIYGLSEASMEKALPLLNLWIAASAEDEWIFPRDDKEVAELVKRGLLEEFDFPAKLLNMRKMASIRSALKSFGVDCPRRKEDAINALISLSPSEADPEKGTFGVFRFRGDLRPIRGKIRKALQSRLFPEEHREHEVIEPFFIIKI